MHIHPLLITCLRPWSGESRETEEEDDDVCLREYITLDICKRLKYI